MKLKKADIEENNQYVDDRDWDAIKENLPFFSNSDGRDLFEDNVYNIRNKMLEVFEVRTDNSLSIWIGGVYHGTFPSLGPIKKINSYGIQFKKIPGMSRGIGVGYIVKPIQDVYDAVLNMRIDNVKLTLNKVFFMDQSANIFGNSTTMKLKPGAIYKVRDVNQVKEMEMSDIKQSAYTELDSMFQMTQGLIGVSAPGLGMQQKVERTAAGAEILKNAADNQLKPLLKSISTAMGHAMKDIITLTHYYMDDDVLESVIGKENAVEFKKINIKSIMNDFDFSYDMTSQSSETMAVKRQQLMSLLEIAARTVDAAGKPVIDVRAVAAELVKTHNLDFDAILSEEDIAKMMKDVQAAQSAAANQGGDFTKTTGTDPVASENAAMNTMNQMG